MKFFRLALLGSAAALCTLRAQKQQQQDEQQQKPPTEIPDFGNLDEYVYIPKSNLNYGYRFTTGMKARFGGKAHIVTEVEPADRTSSNIVRSYHDGEVGMDQRSVQEDLGNGVGAYHSINAADGKTDTWVYTDPSQITPEDFIQYHIYEGNTNDPVSLGKPGKNSIGMEVFVSHDMKKLSQHLEWRVFGGMSINDIQSAAFQTVGTNLTTTTDTYDIYGGTPQQPASSVSVNTTLISSAPIVAGVVTNSFVPDSTIEHFKLHGAYATFRMGPQLMYDFNDHLKVSVSAGPALLFAGSTLEADSEFIAPTAGTMLDTLTNTTNRLLYGYYIDATLEYDVTERAGFYFGAFDQGSTGYTQTASGPGGSFSSRVDFGNQEGVRTGLSYKF